MFTCTDEERKHLGRSTELEIPVPKKEKVLQADPIRKCIPTRKRHSTTSTQMSVAAHNENNVNKQQIMERAQVKPLAILNHCSKLLQNVLQEAHNRKGISTSSLTKKSKWVSEHVKDKRRKPLQQ